MLIFSLLLCASLGVKTQSTNHERVKNILKSNEEPTVKDAVWTALNDIFKVGVLNDGSNRNGYASYVCEVLYDNCFKEKCKMQRLAI